MPTTKPRGSGEKTRGPGAVRRAAKASVRLIWVADLDARTFRVEALRQSEAIAASPSKGRPGFHRRHFRYGMKRGEIWTVAGGKDYAGTPGPIVILQDDCFDAAASVTICAFTTNPADAPLSRTPIQPRAGNGLRAGHVRQNHDRAAGKALISHRQAGTGRNGSPEPCRNLVSEFVRNLIAVGPRRRRGPSEAILLSLLRHLRRQAPAQGLSDDARVTETICNTPYSSAS